MGYKNPHNRSHVKGARLLRPRLDPLVMSLFFAKSVRRCVLLFFSFANVLYYTLELTGAPLHKICVWTQIRKIKRKLIFNTIRFAH